MIIKLRSQLPLALTLLMLWLQFPFPQCEARQLHDDRIVFPDEYKTKMMDTLKTNPVLIRNETKQQEAEIQWKPTVSKNDTVTDSTEKTKDAQENPTVQPNSNETSESPILTEAKTVIPTKVEFGPRTTLDTLPFCKLGLKLEGNHCRQPA